MGGFLGMIYGFHIFPYVSVGKEKNPIFFFWKPNFFEGPSQSNMDEDLCLWLH